MILTSLYHHQHHRLRPWSVSHATTLVVTSLVKVLVHGIDFVVAVTALAIIVVTQHSF